MEESVWIYFGIIMVIVAIGIIAGVYHTSQQESGQAVFLQSIEQMGAQARTVCDSPRETQLSLQLTVPAGATIFTTSDKICGAYKDASKCVPAACALEAKTVLNLTSSTGLFSSRLYTCSFLRQDLVSINCQG
jgi:hypothetical protein